MYSVVLVEWFLWKWWIPFTGLQPPSVIELNVAYILIKNLEAHFINGWYVRPHSDM